MGPVDSVPDRAHAPDDSLARDKPSEFADHRPLDGRNSPRTSEALRQRLDTLPPGHPSSPYDADGGPRQPIPRLRDLETFDEEDPADGEVSAPDADSKRTVTDQGDIRQQTDSGRPADRQADRQEPDISPDTAPQIPDDDSDADPKADGRSDAEAAPEAEPTADNTHPFTDAEWVEHVEEVRSELGKAQADGLSSDKQHTIDPAREIWSAERDLAHDSIINDLYSRSSSVPCEYKAIIAGGLAGAGKTTVLEKYASVDRSQYLTINPDDIKGELARRGLVPEVEGLSPMEASDLVHEESSYLARQLASRARADGKNVIWDITMSSRSSAEQRIDALRASGYTTIEGIFVDIPVDVSTRRADARHREGQNQYRAGTGMGGRYIPSEVINDQAEAEWGSKNRKAFEELKPSCDRWTIYDNSVDGRDPVLADASPSDSI